MSTHSDSSSAKDFAAKVYKLWQDQMTDMSMSPEFLSLYKDFSKEFNNKTPSSQERKENETQQKTTGTKTSINTSYDNDNKLYELMQHITFRLGTIEQRLERIESLIKETGKTTTKKASNKQKQSTTSGKKSNQRKPASGNS